MEKYQPEWYEGVSCGYMEGTIDEIVDRVRKREGIDKFSKTAICDMCSLCTAIGILTGITGGDNIMVVHGPIGCAQLQGTTMGARYVTTTSREDLVSKSYYIPYFICSGIGEKEIIFGGINKLREAILYAEKRFKPRLITVLTCCATQIIGDDVESLVKSLEKEIEAELLYIPTHGLSRSFEGYDAAYKALADKFVDPTVEKLPGSVNIIADKRRTGGEINFTEINRVLHKLGIKLNCRFVRNTTLDSIRNLARAELNVMMCHHAGIVTARYLEEKYGIPYLPDDYPMGIAETVRWYRSILEFLNMEDKAGVLEAEYQQAYPRFAAARKILEGKRIAAIGSPGRMIRWVDLIHELGLELVYMGVYFHMRDKSFEMLREKIKKYGLNPYIVIQAGLLMDEEKLAEFKPDIMFGDASYANFAYRFDIALCHLESAPQLGFSGSLNIAERWADAIKRPVYDFWRQYTELPGHTPRVFGT